MYLSIKQAFLSMFYLLDEYYENNNSDDLGALLGSLNPYLFSGDLPADVATWSEWKKCLRRVIGINSDVNTLTPDVSYNVMIEFLKHYYEDFGFNLVEVIDNLNKNNMLGSKNIKEIWLACVEKVLEDA